MKKIVWILLLIVLLNTKNVFASNYRLKELIRQLKNNNRKDYDYEKKTCYES